MHFAYLCNTFTHHSTLDMASLMYWQIFIEMFFESQEFKLKTQVIKLKLRENLQ